MNLERVEKIAEAVLYEGYMLYPYRPSSIKNQQRWNFGVLYPRTDSPSKNGSLPSGMQTECLMKTLPSARLTIKVRFLQIVQRSIGKLRVRIGEIATNTEPDFEIVDHLELAGRIHRPWQEVIERELSYTVVDPYSISDADPALFSFPAGRSLEYLSDEQDVTAGVIVREWKFLNGSVVIRSEKCRDEVVKISVRIQNLAHLDPEGPDDSLGRESILLDSLISAHTILGVENGEFISLLDHPGFDDLVAECVNVGTWPVLVGDDPTAMLSSPIILYDYPQIAPESTGNLFDSTEIDEILSLRILTLTDAEKREMRQSDDRTREILERTECMPEEQFMKLHGILRRLTVLEEKAQ